MEPPQFLLTPIELITTQAVSFMDVSVEFLTPPAANMHSVKNTASALPVCVDLNEAATYCVKWITCFQSSAVFEFVKTSGGIKHVMM